MCRNCSADPRRPGITSRRGFFQQAVSGAAALYGLRQVSPVRAGPLETTRHLKVFYKDGWWTGWPANHGIWSWGNEILVGFTLGKHKGTTGHTYDRQTARLMFARSLDGGLTWSIEDAYEQGITGAALCHVLGEKAAKPTECPGGINFAHPHFALTFTLKHFYYGPSNFYYSYDRGKSWRGPFTFPDLDTAGIGNRTDYLVEGEHQLLAFLTATKSHRKQRRAACARTVDGGRTWQRVSWIGTENALMPASARLSPSKILTVIRVRPDTPLDPDDPRLPRGLSVYLSEDNAATWRRLDAPELGDLPWQRGRPINNPPAVLRLTDGRLCLVYGVRIAPCSVCARFSSDEGHTWSEEVVLRGNDGANSDMGYPRVVQRPDGKVVAVYFYNHALLDGPPYRYIAATIFDPSRIQH